MIQRSSECSLSSMRCSVPFCVSCQPCRPLSHDIRRDSGIIRHVEVKRRTGGCKQIRGWLEHAQSDALIVDTGGRDVPLVVMRIDTLKAYLDKEGAE